MATVKEREEATVKNQLDLAVRDFIKVMDSESDFNIAIVEEETNSPSFEISVEYPPYKDSPQKFQRHVSNFKAEEIALNIYFNIKNVLGYEYKENIQLSIPPGANPKTPDYNKSQPLRKFSENQRISLFNIIQIRISFREKQGY